jgi:hypothetical protein
MKQCRWSRVKRSSPTLTEWKCSSCGQVAYSSNYSSPRECKSLLGSGYKKIFDEKNSNSYSYRVKKTMSSRTAVILVIAAASVLLFPLVIESASGSCHAVEKRFINTLRKYGNQQDIGATLFLDMFSEATRGEVAARLVKTEYPNLPPFVGCSVIYYKAFFDDREMLKYRNLIQ